MNKTLPLQITGTLSILALAGSLYYRSVGRKQDKLSSAILQVLTARLHPSTKGLENENALDMYYAERVLDRVSGRIAVLQPKVAKRLAKKLHSGFRPWYQGGDKEEVIYGVLRSLQDKVQASQVAKQYHQEFKIHLIEQLQNHLDREEIKKVLEILQRIPNYRTV